MNTNSKTPDRLLEIRELIKTGEARKLREDACLTVAEVARTLEVTPGAVVRWEHGQREPTGRNVREYHALLIRLARRRSRSAQPSTLTGGDAA